MSDLPDRFMMWLMNQFYESLKDDLDSLGKRVSEALTNDKQKDVDTYLRMITETRGIIKDMEDENLEIKDFIHMIAHKYGLMTDGD